VAWHELMYYPPFFRSDCAKPRTRSGTDNSVESLYRRKLKIMGSMQISKALLDVRT